MDDRARAKPKILLWPGPQVSNSSLCAHLADAARLGMLALQQR
ncbi:MAG: hypothetical protein ACRYGK_03450 [Janthinobacterium lividum]